MKQKDIVYAILAAIIFVVAGVIAVTQLAPKNNTAASQANQVEIAQPISSELSQDALKQITDVTKARDYGTTFDLTTGLNNASPFGK